MSAMEYVSILLYHILPALFNLPAYFSLIVGVFHRTRRPGKRSVFLIPHFSLIVSVFLKNPLTQKTFRFHNCA